MKQIPLYRFEREGGGTTVSPNEPDELFTNKLRLIAEDGKRLTKDGKKLYSVIDAESAEGWYEVDAPKEAGT